MFPISKDGYEYSFLESGLQVKSPDGREQNFPFERRLKLRHSSWTGNLFLKGPDGTAPLSPLSEAEKKELVLEFFRRWKAADPEVAKKSAFDYIDGQKGFVALAFTISLLFSLPLAVGLLADSKDQFTCTLELQRNSVVGSMDVEKFKRKRKGHYILDLAFTAPDGTKIVGRDQLIVSDETNIPKTVPVVYSPNNPRCWSLTPNLEGTEVNWAKRRFFGYFAAMFGTFFLVSAFYGLAWSVSRWIRPRPFKAELAKLFSL